MLAEGVAGMVEEEERLDGLAIVNPRSEYLGPSAPVLPPSMLTLSNFIAIIEYHVCNGPIGLRHERFKDQYNKQNM